MNKVEAGFELILEGLGFKWEDDEHLKDTPHRAAKAWMEELCGGHTGDVDEPEVKMFPHEGDSGLIILKNIPIKSLCAHHLLPFIGVATIGYISGNKKILGLSKLSRIANYWARRPQVQEVLTGQIADDIADRVMQDAIDVRATSAPFEEFHAPAAGGVGVLIRARHMCMEMRGVNHSGEMVTSALRGVMQDTEVRAEFLSLAGELE